MLAACLFQLNKPGGKKLLKKAHKHAKQVKKTNFSQYEYLSVQMEEPLELLKALPEGTANGAIEKLAKVFDQ